ncbi:hypothetical protein HXA34_13255 [Salipaludibacillus agaradhaerens]|uniref:hypothetical protein n=1 Tax=Salipaludibacillus agaradhaerens TaxID=76935 RepID=UPI00215142E7|nr:hypothetical protein [Salipaludibacillus agaradhaerens]MCR6107266.1 hypothetical protein [Salipaludibacillus agaradhaerens]MCR6119295.1 hypothetical protein [Salipaludibacillus agaradhaerens]
MKIRAEDLPEKERALFLSIQTLPRHEKQTLWSLIRLSNKDHICIVPRLTPEIQQLIQKGLVTINPSFHIQSKISLFILRKTPFLMKKLQTIGQQK